MKNWRSLVEAIGLFAIVLSLAFVGVQLQQDQRIARSELASGTFDYFSTLSQVVIDPEFAPVYEKMLKNPEDLSDQEMLRINEFLNMAAGLVARECYLTERGVFVECENASQDIIRRYFRSRYARAWWINTDTRMAVELPSWVDDTIRDTKPDRGPRLIEDISQTIQGDT